MKNKSKTKSSKVQNPQIDKEVLTPRQIVEELNRYIVGQHDAKKAVAIALRNRYRRKMVESSLRDEIVPKNILMIGPTGVGKTEIARRLAKLAHAPFIKVEATKFTEVGYVGRDVDSIVRDLIDVAIKQVTTAMKKEVLQKAKENARNKIAKAIAEESGKDEDQEKIKKMLDDGELDDQEVEIELSDNNNNNFSGNIDVPGAQIGIGMINIGEMIGKAVGIEKVKLSRMKVDEAMKTLVEEESAKMIDEDKAIKIALKSVEDDGIVFIDEIDKICNKASSFKNGEVSREGVQRDLLPLVEGTSVSTRYGLIKTDHILFIASGAFHIAKPSDLLPELQGRFPIRVQLKSLTEDDFVKILLEPEASLIKQYVALLGVEGIKLEFTQDGIRSIASFACQINSEIENIGARRLHTMLEKILEEISFTACEVKKDSKFVIDSSYVKEHITGLITGNNDLSKFVL